tara:strand:- start:44928 stop:49820 length:4893 start_codon:yes stop_codon:yes gene_type:complete
MTRQQDETRDQLIQKVVKLVHKKLPKEEADLLSKFISMYAKTAAPEDLIDRSVIDVYGAFLSHWQFINHVEKNKYGIRVYNPNFEQHGWQSTHTVIEIIHPDMPFILESVRMVLNRSALNIHLMLHLGDVQFIRDDNGHVAQIHTNHKKIKNVSTETPIFIEIDRQNNPNILEELKSVLEDVMVEIRAAVTDWQPLKKTLRNTIKRLENDKNISQKKYGSDIIEFLEWINNEHFTFLGFSRRSLIKDQNRTHWKVSKKDNLGILKYYDDNYFEDFESLPKRAQEFYFSPYPLIVGKTMRRSNVHRPAHTDFISLKVFDDNGNVIGEERFVGLYTAAAYNLSPQNIPLLTTKIEKILEKNELSASSYDGKALVNILENFPRDDLFQAPVNDLYKISLGILRLQERQRIRLFVRKDDFGRYYSCLVFVPRDKFNSKLREKIADVLMTQLGGYSIDFNTKFSESVLARIHFIVRYHEDSEKQYDLAELQNTLVSIGRTWADHLNEALVEHYGEEQGIKLCQKYGNAFQVGYRDAFIARTAVFDIQKMEILSVENPLEMSFYRSLEDPEGTIRFKIFHMGSAVPLSDVIPMLECMGVRVLSERPHEVKVSDGYSIWINDFAMVHGKGHDLNVEELKDVFQDTFYNLWLGHAETDGFNHLVLQAGLTWREVMMLRAYAKYMWQIGFTFSQAYIEEVLVDRYEITKEIVKLFLARFDLTVAHENRNTLINELRKKLKDDLEAVNNIDEDRILRKYIDVIMATLRTNFFQLNSDGNPKSYLSIKFDSGAIPEIPLPKPMFEVFVYSPKMEGVHLRGAKVARGGLRWSDRREDFRTEVLGLMKAQQVKNAVIVPLGAKGGFVSKCLPSDCTREAILAEGISCYKIFISALLDITDNLVDGEVVPPQNVIRYDADDTYLVVAADKGTATFSDIANGISQEYGFWLDDAFASGGSTGYDHKKMGITARGAWESVKQHFRELGVDTQKSDFSVIGIGDMAGDVFGNGMLLSKHIKLLGAFNHMHIFLDPNPDSAASYKERLRLFQLPRSSWEDYNQKLISKGGGIFSRSSKYIPLSPEVRAVLGIHKEKIVPNELIRAMLKAQVDLLWNGGIGTYVKASSEHNSEVGDRANDGLRVNGDELKCKVVGEGGNLGFTQLGRVEFALNSGKINTDAIDNSAGVDCSDHEVNIKILLNGIIAQGDMTGKQRNALLVEMTEEVAELVLDNNRLQIEVLSVAEFGAKKNVQMHCRLMDYLETNANLDRNIECLPSNESLIMRHQNVGFGLTRPELSVLLAYTKTLLKSELLASDVPEDEYIAEDMVTAFPDVLKTQFRKSLFEHRLKRELIAMQVSNTILNDMGLGFLHRLQDETGASVPDIVRCYIISREVFRAEPFRDAVDSLDLLVPSEIQTRMLHDLNRLVRRGTRWFLRHRVGEISVKALVEQFRSKVKIVRECIKNTSYGEGNDYIQEYTDELISKEVPEAVATKAAQMSAMFSALDIVDASMLYKLPVESVISTYYAIGGRLELEWFREQVKRHAVANHWDALARAAIRDDLDRQQRIITVAIMLMPSDIDEVEAKIDAWLTHHKIFVERWRHMISDLKALTMKDFTMFSVALRELMELAHISTLEFQQHSSNTKEDDVA